LTSRTVWSPSSCPAVDNPDTSQIESPRYVYGYDAQGNQTFLRDPLGRETWFTFDAQNRQATRTLPLGFGEDGIRGTGDDPVSWTIATDLPSNMPFTERMTYDALGRQHLHVSFEGVVTEHVYSDTTGRLIEKRFFDNLLQYDHGVGDPTWPRISETRFAGRRVSVITAVRTRPRRCRTTWPRLFETRGPSSWNLLVAKRPATTPRAASPRIERKR
jgi:YD repeat-containing protein